jgi:hypothetical protein
MAVHANVAGEGRGRTATAVLWIRDILVTSDLIIWIRNLLFSLIAFKMPKNSFFKRFFCSLLFEGTFTSVFQDKSQEEITKQ